MRITVIEKKNGEQIGKYIYHPPQTFAHMF